MKKNYYLLLIFLMLVITSLQAQTVTFTSVDGLATPNCTSTPGVAVTPDNMTLTLAGTYTGTPTNLFVQHQYNFSTTTNFTQVPSINYSGGTFTYDFVLDNTVFDGENASSNIIQILFYTGANVTSSCYFFLDSVSTVPVELTYFQGKETLKTNTLEWQTATEENNSHFEVERSTDGKNFEVIGTVEGNGTIYEVVNYEFVDESPFVFAYYRLRQVDFDGAFEYTDAITINRNEIKGDDLVVYPIPVINYMNIQYTATAVEDIAISIVDVNGRVISNQTTTALEGENTLNVNCSDLQSGIYFLKIQSANSSIVRPITKQ